MSELEVPVERVHGRVRRAAPPPSPEPGAPAPDLSEEAAAARPSLTVADVVPVGVVGLVGLVSGELVVSVMAGVAALGALALRRLAIRERFGFGDGFTPFRSELGWPQGIQEDDDFHWSWAAPRDEAGPGSRRPIAR